MIRELKTWAKNLTMFQSALDFLPKPIIKIKIKNVLEIKSLLIVKNLKKAKKN